MDTLREAAGSWGDASCERDDSVVDAGGDVDHEPRHSFGTDERRMQVRAYNHWASLIGERALPSIEDLDPERIPDFGPYSVLLDFTSGIENPAITFLGDELARVSGMGPDISYLTDVPPRSLLSRITDHYMQIIANQAPIGFEAEFTDQRGHNLLYRGILLPFSSDDDTIDFIYGVINWKECADAQVSAALHQSLQDSPAPAKPQGLAPLPWRDAGAGGPQEMFPSSFDDIFDLKPADIVEEPAEAELPVPTFGAGDDGNEDDCDADHPGGQAAEEADPAAEMPADLAGLSGDGLPRPIAGSAPDRPTETDDGRAADAAAFPEPVLSAKAAMPAPVATPSAPAPSWAEGLVAAEDELDDAPPADASLADWLAHARAGALSLARQDERGRAALYAAIDRAYAFAHAADRNPEDYAEILADAGIVPQPRAPFTPVVKLVFGSNYDKTRLTEFATALGHAWRIDLPPGRLASHLATYPGGLKGLVAEERRMRRLARPAEGAPADPRERLAERLRRMPPVPLADMAAGESEFVLVLARRAVGGGLEALAAVPQDGALVERAARMLLRAG